MTNVKPDDLNYDHYETSRYDDEIVRSIPGHREMHGEIIGILQKDFFGKSIRVLELGPGTGLTTECIFKNAMVIKYQGIDFSETMLKGTRKRLGSTLNVELTVGDYAETAFSTDNDLVVSVIGMHHQVGDEAKLRLFTRIKEALAPDGIFLLGDLMTFRDPHKAATCEAKHYHYLVENAPSEDSLREWSHHHRFLNVLSPLEDHIELLKKAGFADTVVVFEKFNTVALVAKAQ